MKSNRRNVAGNHTRNCHKRHKKHKGFIELCLFVAQVAGEQMRHGLKPCDAASDPVAKPTRFFVEM